MISSLPRDARSVGEIRDEKAPDQIKPQQQHNLGLHTPTRHLKEDTTYLRHVFLKWLYSFFNPSRVFQCIQNICWHREDVVFEDMLWWYLGVLGTIYLAELSRRRTLMRRNDFRCMNSQIPEGLRNSKISKTWLCCKIFVRHILQSSFFHSCKYPMWLRSKTSKDSSKFLMMSSKTSFYQ